MNFDDLAQLHHDIRGLVRTQKECDLALARGLAAMSEDRRYRQFGASSMAEYMRDHVDLGPGKAKGLLAIGRRMRVVPELVAAMEDESLGWTKVRDVARVAESETLAGWLDVARNWNSRELELAVREAHVGDSAPDVAERPVLAAPTFTLQFSGEKSELVRKAIALRRTSLGDGAERLTNEDVLMAIVDAQLVADAQTQRVSTERFQTVIQRCPDCEQTVQVGLADGVEAEVSESVAARAACDSSTVDMQREGKGHKTVTATMRRFVLARDGYCCRVPGCNNTIWLEVHHVEHQEHGGAHDPGNLVALCSAHHGLHHDGLMFIEFDSHGEVVIDLPGRKVQCEMAFL